MLRVRASAACRATTCAASCPSTAAWQQGTGFRQGLPALPVTLRHQKEAADVRRTLARGAATRLASSSSLLHSWISPVKTQTLPPGATNAFTMLGLSMTMYSHLRPCNHQRRVPVVSKCLPACEGGSAGAARAFMCFQLPCWSSAADSAAAAIFLQHTQPSADKTSS